MPTPIFMSVMTKKPCSETELVERARTDLDSFGELVERYRGCIVRQCQSRVRDAHLAEDLAQDTFIRAYLKLDQLREPSFFAGWLRRIASNVCSEFARGPVRAECAWDYVPEQHAADTFVPLGCDLGLDALPEAMRECVELYYGEQLSYAEIAEATGASEAIVRNRLHRARALLRKEMPELATYEKRTFTERVMSKLRTLENGDANDRARAASDLRGSLDEDRYQSALNRLRSWTELGLYGLAGAIRQSKRYRTAEVREALVAILLGCDEEGARIKAAGALVAQKDPSVIGHLRQVADDPAEDRDVAAAAKSAIAQLKKMELPPPQDFESFRLRKDVQDAANDKSARLELMKKLVAVLEDPSAAVRGEAVKALARLGDKRAAPALARLLKDPVPGMRDGVAAALGQIGGKTAVAALAQAIDEQPSLRRTALNALRLCGDSSAVPAVLRVIEQSPGDNTMYHFTMSCLASIASADDLEAIREIASRFVPYREGQELYVNVYWINVLARAADKQHLPELREALRTVPLDWWKEVDELITAVWRTGEPEAVEILEEHFTTRGSSISDTVSLRGPGIEAGLGALRGDSVASDAHFGRPGFEALKEALANRNPDVRYSAYWTHRFAYGNTMASGYLVSLGEPGLRALKTALRSENPEVRYGAYLTIHNGGGAALIHDDPDAVNALKAAVSQEQSGGLKLPAKAALRRLNQIDARGGAAETGRDRP